MSKYTMARRLFDAIKQIIKSNSVTHQVGCNIQREGIKFRARIDYTESRLRYSAPIHPLKLIYIDPHCITEMLTSPVDNRRFRRLSPVIDGKWDEKTRSLFDYDLFYSVHDHFKHDIPWEETDLYSRVQTEIEGTDDWGKWGCTNFEDFKHRLTSLDRLYESIQQDGYKTQRELEQSGTGPIKTRPCLPPEWHEVTVHLDRDGKFIFHEGRHRLAIAQAIELDSIPVRIMVRHENWQSQRDRVYSWEGDTDSEVSHHPDITPRE